MINIIYNSDGSVASYTATENIESFDITAVFGNVPYPLIFDLAKDLRVFYPNTQVTRSDVYRKIGLGEIWLVEVIVDYTDNILRIYEQFSNNNELRFSELSSEIPLVLASCKHPSNYVIDRTAAEISNSWRQCIVLDRQMNTDDVIRQYNLNHTQLDEYNLLYDNYINNVFLESDIQNFINTDYWRRSDLIAPEICKRIFYFCRENITGISNPNYPYDLIYMFPASESCINNLLQYLNDKSCATSDVIVDFVQPNPGIPNPEIPNPEIPNPEIPNPGIPNPGIPNPGIPNPGIPNPGIPNPGIPNPGIPNPGIPNPGIGDLCDLKDLTPPQFYFDNTKMRSDDGGGNDGGGNDGGGNDGGGNDSDENKFNEPPLIPSQLPPFNENDYSLLEIGANKYYYLNNNSHPISFSNIYGSFNFGSILSANNLHINNYIPTQAFFNMDLWENITGLPLSYLRRSINNPQQKDMISINREMRRHIYLINKHNDEYRKILSDVPYNYSYHMGTHTSTGISSIFMRRNITNKKLYDDVHELAKDFYISSDYRFHYYMKQLG